MRRIALRRVKTKTDEVRQLQDAIEAALGDFSAIEILQGQLLSDPVSLTSGTSKAVEHGLGRELRGWIVVGRSSSATVWDSQATNPTPTRTLVLNASATVTVKLWVF